MDHEQSPHAASLQAELDAANTRYEALRSRKAVRAALWLSGLRDRTPHPRASEAARSEQPAPSSEQPAPSSEPPGAAAPPPANSEDSATDVSKLVAGISASKARLAEARQALGDEIVWYQYDILANLSVLDALLHGEHRDLERLAGGRPVADIGAADGDLAFTLEHQLGWQVDIVDNAATNQNGLRAARALRERLGSEVGIEDIDLDTQFRLPRDRYGLVFFLGILYHLQNPFHALRELAKRSDYCLLSTKVARFAGGQSTRLAELPVAYLVSPTETNNDATNYWMFSPAGLERIVARAGWSVLERLNIGDVEGSDPSSPEHDERAFMLLRSTARTD